MNPKSVALRETDRSLRGGQRKQKEIRQTGSGREARGHGRA